jgi:hypothetical protein
MLEYRILLDLQVKILLYNVAVINTALPGQYYGISSEHTNVESGY